MEFELDKQTIKDLGLFGDALGKDSIFDFYNRTKTIGGRDYLWDLMKNPITDVEELNDRVALIEFLTETGFEINFDVKQFDYIEHYLKLRTSLRNNLIEAFFQYLYNHIKPNNDYYLIQTGVQQLLGLIFHVKEKIKRLNGELPKGLKERVRDMNNFIAISEIADLIDPNFKLSFVKLNKLDSLFREKYNQELKNFLKILYSIDAYNSVSNVAKQFKLGFPEYLDSSSNVSITNFYHPLLKGAVPYDIEITNSSSLCFLSGPNMAGKSTFLKSLGLSIYLSHLGFPVPAEKMRTSVYHGIMTTINLSDNMSRGYSHFYSEVKRVKEVALKLKEKGKLFVIFDELFRGTNIKDAYDASLLIINAFGRVKRSTFFVSTHITEIGEKLNEINSIQFRYFESKLIDGKPVYEYKIKEGISHERLGLQIVKNERIVEILNSIDS